jgi:anaerobic dimethyl sulfoxide reductase subunit A
MKENREEKVFYDTCAAAGCHQLCALKVWVREGEIRKLESADYPGDPSARSICLKGLSNARLVYHSDRLKYPLKRTGPCRPQKMGLYKNEFDFMSFDG